MSDTELKLFVWPHFCPDYDDGLAFAIAPDELTAEDLVAQHYGRYPLKGSWGPVEVYPLSLPIGFGARGSS